MLSIVHRLSILNSPLWGKVNILFIFYQEASRSPSPAGRYSFYVFGHNSLRIRDQDYREGSME
ncbi:MAG: hypothetical protein ACFB8W_10170 [Elainellaceae cyanobacterium]